MDTMSPRGAAIFVESNTTGHGYELMRRATELGMQAVLVSADPSRYDFHDAVQVIRIDEVDTESVLSAISGLRATPELVTSTSDRHLGVSAEVAASLDLRGHPPNAVIDCQNKETQRRKLADSAVSVPDFIAAGDPGGAYEAAARLGDQVVVKPTRGSGSVGVRLCADPDQAAAAAAAILLSDAAPGGQVDRVLVERAVPGREVSVEILAGGIVGITESRFGAPPSFVEVGHEFPAQLTRTQRAAISATAMGALVALDLEHGEAHVEIRFDDVQAWVVEVNPRLPGGRITTLVRLASGIDMLTEHLQFLRGMGSVTFPTRHRACAIRYIMKSDLPGPTRRPAEPISGLVEAELAREIDDEVHGDFRDRVGHVIAIADDTATAASRAETACRSGFGRA